jgi:hypothetical protein
MMKDEARYKNAERRRQEFEDKVKEKAAKKQRRDGDRGQRREREEGG